MQVGTLEQEIIRTIENVVIEAKAKSMHINQCVSLVAENLYERPFAFFNAII